MSIRTIIADDHAIFREGLRMLLNNEADVTVVGEAGTGTEVVLLARELKPDVVVMDITMPDMSGIEATRKIVEENGSIRVLALSMESDRRYVVEVIEAGATGYLLKEMCSRDLVEAIHTVAAGEKYLCPRTTELVIRDYLQRIPDNVPLTFSCLTEREREFIQLIANGKNSKEIAAEFNISIKTVEVHRQNIMKKLNLYSIAELTKYAVREGLTSLR